MFAFPTSGGQQHPFEHPFELLPQSMHQPWTVLQRNGPNHLEQVSGVCNRTLGGGGSDTGYRGQSIGAKLIVSQASAQSYTLPLATLASPLVTGAMGVTGLGADNDLDQGAAAVHELDGGRWWCYNRKL